MFFCSVFWHSAVALAPKNSIKRSESLAGKTLRDRSDSAITALSSDAAHLIDSVADVQPKILVFEAHPSKIRVGESVTLRWETENTLKIGILPQIGTVAHPNGTRTIRPATTTTYTLVAFHGEAFIEQKLTIVVEPPLPLIPPPQPDLFNPGDYIVLDIAFPVNRTELPYSAHDMLDELAEKLLAKRLSVEIVGHTDSKGSSRFNYNLSVQRAAAVKKYLIRRGVPASWLRAYGVGSNEPITRNKTKEGREKNRRIEVKVIKVLK
ncbi:OmpA/MotB domain protein [Chloroherpeton thalassium ATCC 35110]|uniref:OmpA/MotB domain protein n=1 Tax=Chloroherpeton thalassium (strain ATCC 35110 / GB-78) TaxID=517418 RepID=B3QS96_CHLT3|nr:OmpA family protein [Chloroherpeton thalassium]ACF12487.1 OmpA/MotB domain protein [Chloroherpeton thalassium ATCC 35110]